MNKSKKNSEPDVKLIKHHIKDLSFENPQSINDNNVKNNNKNNISSTINFIYEPFENDFFSIIFKYSCEGYSKTTTNKLFLLELDYFGFFKIVNNKTNNEADFTKKGAELMLPFVKSIVEELSAKGGSIPLTFESLDFDIVKV
jgi:preprotein translocase subunit SecB